jgi:hypothetical protein
MTPEKYFAGNYETEEHATADLDRILESSGLFRIYREVEGYYLSHRPNREQKQARIDRILVPDQRLRDKGWNAIVGVEAKRTGANVGPAVAQAIDYTWCMFRVGSTYLYPEWIFLWPLEQQYGGLESVMAQNRIGHVYTTHTKARGEELIFGQSATRLLSIGAGGEFSCRGDLVSIVGRKTGSR